VFTTLVHIDAYRLKPGEAETIGWSGVTSDPRALVIVEWPTLLDTFPKEAQTLVFSVTSEHERSVEYV
jgi:tRNA A37 threonylcarbamoyladenosine biosynthesis protein TsaE